MNYALKSYLLTEYCRIKVAKNVQFNRNNSVRLEWGVKMKTMNLRVYDYKLI